MDYKEITALIKLIEKTNLSEFKMKNADVEISIKTDKYQKNKQEIQHITTAPREVVMAPPAVVPAPVVTDSAPAADKAEQPTANPTPEASNLLEVKSPIVGTFYRSSAPDKPPFVSVGDTIAKGDTVCIVEAMKLFNEIDSEVSGKIVKVLAEDASPVEYDQVLFLVDPKG